MSTYNKASDPHAKPDETGTVVVSVCLKQGGKIVKGNLTKSVSIKNARVSDVFGDIHKCLFGQEWKT